MIVPIRLMIKSSQPIDTVECKIYCNEVEFPTALVDQGEHFDIYQNKNLFYTTIESVFECEQENNRLAVHWPQKPKADFYEIDDIEIDFFYIDKHRLLKETSFLQTNESTLQPKPNKLDNNYWAPGTLINNPGIMYLTFSLPIASWCFKNLDDWKSQ